MSFHYANWSLNRKSPWHRVNEDDLDPKPLCGMRVRDWPEWSHSQRPTATHGHKEPRFCESCEAEVARVRKAPAARCACGTFLSDDELKMPVPMCEKCVTIARDVCDPRTCPECLEVA